jgi:serine/threonine protein kinase
MELTVEGLCKALARSRLLTPDAVRGLYRRWLREAKESAPDLRRFTRWLVDNEVASEYQLGVLARGHGDQLYLNQYKIIERVGRGRMAGVYKAVHNLGQTVAIKVLPLSKARDALTFARFQREARLAVLLQHPNVVRTFHFDEADGLHYLVMEYLEGETLAEVLTERGRLSVAAVATIARQALLGLQHVHEKGLVHRDITPANFMLIGRENEETKRPTVKILDIGMGRELFEETDAPSGNKFTLTSDGDVLGTPLYMSPEQAGDPRTVDIRADLYGLGCVLYHALTGGPPFDDKNNVRLLVRHATEPARPLADFRDDVPPGLQDVFDRLLAKDRSKRFATPAEALNALQSVMVAPPDPAIVESPEFRAYVAWLEKQKAGEYGGPATDAGSAGVESSPTVGAGPTGERGAAKSAAQSTDTKDKSHDGAGAYDVDLEAMLKFEPVHGGRDLILLGAGVGLACFFLVGALVALLLLH